MSNSSPINNTNTSNNVNPTKQSREITVVNTMGNLLSYGSINLTLTLELFENDFIQNDIEWKKLKNLSNLQFLKENNSLWERIQLSSTEKNMQLLLHMNRVLKEKIKIKHICFRKMKFKQSQKEFEEFLKNIINLNGLYFESYSLCRCELSIQLRLRYNGKRRLFVLCGDRSPLDDDGDEDNSFDNREEDNEILGEGADYEQYQEENDNEQEEEVYEINEKKDDEEYNPFINMPKDINNFNDFYFIYFNYFDYIDGIFNGNITIEQLYKYIIFLKKNSKARIILNMTKEISDNSEQIRDLLSVCSITIFYDKNKLFQLLNKLRYEEDKIKKEEEHFRHYYEKKLKDKEIDNFLRNEERREKIIENLKNKNDTSENNQLDDEKSYYTYNKTMSRTFYSMKTSKSRKKQKQKKEKEEEKMIIIKNNKYFPPLSKVDIFNYYKTGIYDKDPLKSREEKIIIVLDDFYKVYIVQFNYNLEKPFVLDFDLNLYPQINVHNINEIQDYKEFIKENFERYIIIFIGYLLSSLSQGGGGGNINEEETSLFKGYYGACKVLRNIIGFEKYGMNLPKEDYFYYPNLNKYEVEALIEHANQKKKEYKFILDCNNKNVIKLKLYNPLLDKHVFSYLKKNTNKDILKIKGFINNKGKLLYDPVYRESLIVNKNEKYIKDEKELYKTCHDFKTKNNFKMKENECLDRYKNKNEKLNKFVIGFKQKRPEYEIYLRNIKYNRFPIILQKNRNCNTHTFLSPNKKKSFSVAKSKTKTFKNI